MKRLAGKKTKKAVLPLFPIQQPVLAFQLADFGQVLTDL